MIRVWIKDPALRALVFAFLRSPGAQDQLLRNEYGTDQRYLEPSHVADLQLPLPDDHVNLAEMMETATTPLDARERSIEMEERADTQILNLLGWVEETQR